jgi:hypothetical protein
MSAQLFKVIALSNPFQPLAVVMSVAVVESAVVVSACWDGVRKRGSSVRQFWWAQSMDLETARAARLAGPVVVTDDGEE